MRTGTTFTLLKSSLRLGVGLPYARTLCYNLRGGPAPLWAFLGFISSGCLCFSWVPSSDSNWKWAYLVTAVTRPDNTDKLRIIFHSLFGWFYFLCKHRSPALSAGKVMWHKRPNHSCRGGQRRTVMGALSMRQRKLHSTDCSFLLRVSEVSHYDQSDPKPTVTSWATRSKLLKPPMLFTSPL